MKKNIFAMLLCLAPILLMAKDTSGTKIDGAAFEKRLVVHANTTLAQLLQDISIETGIPFCLENCVGENSDVDMSSLKSDDFGKTINQIIDELKKSGCVISQYEFAFLVSTPSVANVKNNPLEMKTQNFQFQGSHKEFINKIAVAFPESLPSGLEFFGGLQLELEIRRDGVVSLREILMEATIKSKMTWFARIAPEEKYTVIKGGDGNPKKIKVSRLQLLYSKIP